MATTAKSVQAKDPESVVTFYNNMQVPAFSIRQGNQLMYSYEGESLEDGTAELEQYMEQFILRPRSAAIYTLCVHTNVKGKISNKTEYNGSINLRFYDYNEVYAQNPPAPNYQYQTPVISKELEGKINGLTMVVADLQKKINAPVGKEEEENRLGVIGEILDHPLGFAIGKAIIERMIPGTRVPEPAGMISGPENQSLEETHKKLNESLIVLIEADPNIPFYLSKLADLVRTDRKKFDGFVNMVKMFF